ncbi:tyrosine--tRNA ligase, mitochondrial-like [Pomacea canaliculata]|uniref:tyrosine--tRNA ligase, mitochondrial-like n=1 Tax=Pomacea canaliculata TaxID=400727 RepID=UPI000D72DC02|nr:tyrosine--tRNA ligase, mitochondrial-like [Pomacea canaliculata]
MAASFGMRVCEINNRLLFKYYRWCWSCLQKVRTKSTMSKDVLNLYDRGVFQRLYPDGSAPDLAHHLAKSQTVYCGFDPTSDSLHIGNLLALIALLHLQCAGHSAIALIGGATALIGDPSGKTKEREAMPLEEVEKNAQKLKENVHRVFYNYSSQIHSHLCKNSSLIPVRVLNNMEWYKDWNIVEFLSKVGRNFRMGSMLSKQSVQSRLNSSEGMSFTEFTYQIFQAFDWLYLLQKHDCSIQIGGNDQLGNITAGLELIQRYTKQHVFGLTVPLITSTSGDKLGKTAGNAIWLDSNKTSPFELYQYFLNVADSDVERYLKLFTFLPLEEISALMSKHMEAPEKYSAQKKLAEQVTLLVHGGDGLKTAIRCTEALYGGSAEAVANMEAADLQQLFRQAPVHCMFLDPGMTVLDVCMKAGCFGRIVDAERIIKAGGVYFNYQRVTQPDFVLIPGEHILPNNVTLIRIGKKNYYIVNWAQ